MTSLLLFSNDCGHEPFPWNSESEKSAQAGDSEAASGLLATVPELVKGEGDRRRFM